MRTSSHLVPAAAGMVLVLSGCAVGGQDCTDMGAYSGISFVFSSVLTKAAARDATVEACVNAQCTRRTLENRRDSQVFIQDDALDDDTPVPVALTITTTNGEVVFDDKTEVTPEKSQPNGPGCDPTVYRTQVIASGAGTLTVDGE